MVKYCNWVEVDSVVRMQKTERFPEPLSLLPSHWVGDEIFVGESHLKE